MKNEYAQTNYEMALEVLRQKGKVKSGYNKAYIPVYGQKGTYFGTAWSEVLIKFSTLKELVKNGKAEMHENAVRPNKKQAQRFVTAI